MSYEKSRALMSAIVFLTLLALAAPEPAAGQPQNEADETEADAGPLTWVNHGADEYWSNPLNWDGVRAPEPVEARRVVFPGEPGGWVPVMLDRDQTLRGGLAMSGHRGTVRLVLGGHTLTLAGGSWHLGGNANSSVITEGRIQLGDEQAAVEWRVFDDAGRRERDETVTFTDSVTLRLVNCARLLVNHATGNRNAQGTLDLGETTFADHRLRVDDELRVGYYRGSVGGRGAEGSVRLPPTLGAIEVGTFAIGDNQVRQRNVRGSPTYAHGTVDFGEGEQLALIAKEALILGRGDNARATLERLPARFDLKLGDADEPAALIVGYKDRGQQEAESVDNAAVGRFTSPGGSIHAHLATLRVGQNTRDAGSASGVVDLGDVSLEHLSVTDEAVIGKGVGAAGRVRLPAGDVSMRRLVVGSDAEDGSGALELTDTRLHVEDELVIGESGRLTLTFAEDVSDATDPHWMLRIAGDARDLLEAALDDGRIRVEAMGVDEDDVGVFRSNGDTYLGVSPKMD